MRGEKVRYPCFNPVSPLFNLSFFPSLKTSLLKWRPDYDVAADDYSKAGGSLCSCMDANQYINACGTLCSDRFSHRQVV